MSRYDPDKFDCLFAGSTVAMTSLQKEKEREPREEKGNKKFSIIQNVIKPSVWNGEKKRERIARKSVNFLIAVINKSSPGIPLTLKEKVVKRKETKSSRNDDVPKRERTLLVEQIRIRKFSFVM